MNTNEKLRNALELCMKNMCKYCKGRAEKSSPGVSDCEIFRIAKEALDAPRLNCEVGTPEERLHRYHNLCREISDRHDRIGELAPLLAFPTAFEWEDRPYEESEVSHG